MKFNRYDINRESFDKLKEVCPLNTYRIVDLAQIPLTLPLGLHNKSFNKVVIVGSGDTVDAFYMINVLRIDKNAIDQQPLMVGYHSGDSGIDLTAGFINHGSWKDRTVYPGIDFFHAIEGSGILNYYPYAGIPEKEYGSIKELKPDSHNQAFWNGVNLIRNDT